MMTPKDIERCRAFQRWVTKIDGKEAAQTITGIGERSLNRILGETKPPPVRMLPTLAQHARDNGWADVADALDRAAEPADA